MSTINLGCCVIDTPLDDEQATVLAEQLKALADPTRVRLVSLLATAPTGELCACELPAAVGKSQPTVSHHLSLLSAAGLIEREQRGKWAWFRLRDGALAAVRAALGEGAVARPSRRPRVLFLCVHNAGRSQMAAGFLRDMVGEQVDVLSAGSNPAESVNPIAVAAMAERGIDIAHTTPTRWTDDQVRDVDVIVSMGCGDECPAYPGVRRIDWDARDPAEQSIDVVRDVRDDIEARVRDLVDQLGVSCCA